MKKQCVRCWVHIENKYNVLWCDKCKERVDEELRGEISRPFEYYFRFNLKRIKHDKNKMQNVLKRDRKEMN